MRLIIVLFLLTVNAWGAGGQRIISTSPGITETLFAMGLGPRVVGVTIYCNYPEEAKRVTRIGTLLKPDVEAILALHPDLVVVQKQPNHLPEELARLHVTFVEVQSQNLEAIYAGARIIGKATNAGAAAEQMVQSMQADMQSIAKLAAGRPRPTVAFIVGHTPGRLEGLIAGAGASYFTDLITAAGGTNIFADAIVPYPRISLESILSRNPDVILELSGEEQAKQLEVTAVWSSHRTLKAVATGRVYAIPPGPALIPGPRAAAAARGLLYMLHPETRP